MELNTITISDNASQNQHSLNQMSVSQRPREPGDEYRHSISKRLEKEASLTNPPPQPKHEEVLSTNHAEIDKILDGLEASRAGLTEAQVQDRLVKYGFNQLNEKQVNPIIKFLGFLWNPLSWVMELAALISIIFNDFADFGLILGLLIFNACIGYYEERSAGNALAALKSQLAPMALALRDGRLQEVDATRLVPGDIIELRLGAVIPADCHLIGHEAGGSDKLKIDQSALTGESLPAVKFIGQECYSGSIVKEGETFAVVTGTGSNTFFGKAATLVQQTENDGSGGHFQKVLAMIGWFCIVFIALFVALELIVQFGIRRRSCDGVKEGQCNTVNNALVLIVGGIPIAMPTVMSVTMALGASQLAKKQTIVSRLTAVEELAGMDLLCSDKTGTLTLNQLTVDEPICFGELTKEEVIFDAALASNLGEKPDAIDTAIGGCLTEREIYSTYKLLKFVPFDPVSKRTMATVQGPDGRVFWTSKGAPLQILAMTANKDVMADRVHQIIEDCASRGFRALAVARANDAEGKVWYMEGILPLFDPPRHDTKDTLKALQRMGVGVKMITGDHLAIAKETARRLEIGTNIFNTKALVGNEEDPTISASGISKKQLIENADGFAEVFPEHKFDIVRVLQKNGHICGMTGDGVNDAPALKKADIGIAVAGATDAARAAADIILLSPGLGVIIDATVGARKIFQRMRNYATYSVTTCVRIVTTFGILTVAYDWYFPTIVIVILAILNDGTIMTISKDKATPSETPDQWRPVHIFTLAIILGSYLTLSTIIFFEVCKNTSFPDKLHLSKLTEDELRGLIYLQVSISGAVVIFVTRAHKWSFLERPSKLLLLAVTCSQVAATFIAVYGFNGYPDIEGQRFRGCGWGYALFTWIWCAVWFLPLDLIKMGVKRALANVEGGLSGSDKKKKHQKQKTFSHPFYVSPNADPNSSMRATLDVPPSSVLHAKEIFDHKNTI